MCSVMLTITDNCNATCVVVYTKVSRDIAIGKHPITFSNRFLEIKDAFSRATQSDRFNDKKDHVTPFVANLLER